jgi:DNA topoisomerase-1
MKLIIVESPGKIKTISSFLSSDYKVMASIGHIRLLDKTGKYNLGLDVDGDFSPSYKNDPKKKDVIKALKEAASKAEMVYLAMDADLEGESIAWHLKEILKIPAKKLKRITFNEITKSAVLAAINSPRDIDDKKVNAQETRRFIDRIAGFRLSGLALSKLNSKSAGRVQSAALKILVDKEKEIRAFKPEVYFDLYLPFTKGKKKYEAQYEGSGTKVEKRISDKKKLDTIIKDCEGREYKVDEINQTTRNIKSKPPYTTSSFQQEISSKLNYGSKKAMEIAQKLYEGMVINGTHYGLITYMRTDSIRLSDDFIKVAKEKIVKDYGKKYYSGKINGATSDTAQDAHEGIRPTYLELTPDMVKPFVSNEEYKVYQLVYTRTLASLMVDVQVKDTKVLIKNGKHKFGIAGNEIVFDGFYVIYKEYNEEDKDYPILPAFTKDEIINADKLRSEKKETQPPKRYTEATLVKTLEKLGIGRPSTYSSIMETLTGREYSIKDGKVLIAQDKGILLIEMLEKYFDESILNIDYTADLEKTLDDIATGGKEKLAELKKFYEEFNPLVLKANREFKGNNLAEETDEKCPTCGAPLLIRQSKYGKFKACSRYPHCKFTEAIMTEEEKAVKDVKDKELSKAHTCPVCNKGKIVKRVATKGKSAGSIFYACNNFPKCKTTYNEEEYAIKFEK